MPELPLDGPGAPFQPGTATRWADASYPMLVGHRGGGDNALAGSLAPENTLSAFRLARRYGVPFELDVRLTADGVPVVLHDATVDRTTDGTGEIRAKTLAEVRLLDAGSHYNASFAGERVPALDEVAREFSGYPKAVELKSPDAALLMAVAAVVNAYDDAPWCQVLVGPAASVLADIRAHLPAVGSLHCTYGARSLGTAIADCTSHGVDSIGVDPTNPGLTAAFTAAAHSAGIVVRSAAATPSEWLALRALGVDAMQCDDLSAFLPRPPSRGGHPA